MGGAARRYWPMSGIGSSATCRTRNHSRTDARILTRWVMTADLGARKRLPLYPDQRTIS
jgi:hypothetical protein